MMSQCLLWVHFPFFLLVGQVPCFSLFPGIFQLFFAMAKTAFLGDFSQVLPKQIHFFQFFPSFCWFLVVSGGFLGSPVVPSLPLEPRGHGHVAPREARGAAGRVAAGRGAVALGEDAGAGRLGGAEAPHHAPRRETRERNASETRAKRWSGGLSGWRMASQLVISEISMGDF